MNFGHLRFPLRKAAKYHYHQDTNLNMLIYIICGIMLFYNINSKALKGVVHFKKKPFADN